jgi:lipoate-protein ligase A
MPSSPVCRVLVESRPHDGAWNMAVDEALLEAALDRGECFVRWYRWADATVSLGYFQDASQAARISPQIADLPLVRRMTGGGAILHHHELTYSCVVPSTHPLARVPHELYDAVHERIVAVLAGHGVHAKLRGGEDRRGDEPFLCFGRGDPHDVVVASHKVLGSAQRRRRGAVLQHGSLILSRSPFAPQFPGILDLVPGADFGINRLSELANALGSLLSSGACLAELSDSDAARAQRLKRTRYGWVDWRSSAPTSG